MKESIKTPQSSDDKIKIPLPKNISDFLNEILQKSKSDPYNFKNNLISLSLDEMGISLVINSDEDNKKFLKLIEIKPNNNEINGIKNEEAIIQPIEKQQIGFFNFSNNHSNSINNDSCNPESRNKNELEKKEKYYEDQLEKMENKIKQLSEDNQKLNNKVQEFDQKMGDIDKQKKNNEQEVIEKKQELEKKMEDLNNLIPKKEKENKDNSKIIREIQIKNEKLVQEIIESVEKSNTKKGDEDKKKLKEDLITKMIEENKKHDMILLQIQQGQKNLEDEIKKLKNENGNIDLLKNNEIKELKDKLSQKELENKKLGEKIQNLKVKKKKKAKQTKLKTKTLFQENSEDSKKNSEIISNDSNSNINQRKKSENNSFHIFTDSNDDDSDEEKVENNNYQKLRKNRYTSQANLYQNYENSLNSNIDEREIKSVDSDENTKIKRISDKIKTILFIVDYDTGYGKELGIRGSIIELGNWEKTLPMNYKDGHWEKALKISYKTPKKFEFKMIITENNEILKWENRFNHELDLEELFELINIRMEGQYKDYEYYYFDPYNKVLKLVVKIVMD